MSNLAAPEDPLPQAEQLRHIDRTLETTLFFWDVELDWLAHRVRRGLRPIHLSTLDVKILRFLMLSPTRVFTRDEILQAVWPPGIFVSERTVDVHMAALRKALNHQNALPLVRTIRGRGYSLDIQNSGSRDPIVDLPDLDRSS